MKKPHQFPIKPTDFLGDYDTAIEDKPFRYVVLDNLFNKRFYKQLCKEFDVRLSLGLSEKSRKDRFARFSHYDAYCWTLNPKSDKVFSNFFFSRPWRLFVNSFFKLTLNENTIAEFHHHKIESKDGYIHNDYDLVGFKNSPMKNGVNPWYHQCTYLGNKNGQSVRSLACLYYFNNPEWKEGDGGETALFKASKEIDKVPPINNRFLVFQISPKSFHAFRQNKINVRNCLVQWFHMDKKVAVGYYGAEPNQ